MQESRDKKETASETLGLAFVLGVLLWSLVVGGSYFMTKKAHLESEEQRIYDASRSFFEVVLHHRLWNARHGGVYVPITEETQPNTYLKDAERDIVTVEGKKLTKINPAYMTRMVSELSQEMSGVYFHITALNPIRPANAPTGWESEALKEFEKGSKEYHEYAGSDRTRMFRYMAPLYAAESCLNCHRQYGAKLNQVLGGISVVLPAPKQTELFSTVFWMHLGVFLAGIIGLGIAWRKLEMLTHRLEISRDNAISADKAKTSFIANVSHEIRNPLNGITGMSQMLSEMNLKDGERDCVEAICASADSLKRLLSDVLDFAKMEAGELSLREEFFGLQDVLRKTLSTVAKEAEQKGLDLYVKISPEVPAGFEGDEDRMCQLLHALLSNAVKFTTGGEVEVRIDLDPAFTLSDDVSDVCPLRVAIRDTGKGISDFDRQKIEEVFDRNDESASVGHSGLGIGLTLAGHLVDAMRGKIFLKKDTGEGCEFVVVLPLKKAKEEMFAKKEIIDFEGRQALVCSSFEGTRSVLRSILRMHGFSVREVSVKERFFNELSAGASTNYIQFLDAVLPQEELQTFLENRGEAPDKAKLLLVTSMPEKFRLSEDLFRNVGFLNRPVIAEDVERILSRFSMGFQRSSGRAKHDSEMKGLKILLVEDNEINLRLATKTLVKMGHDVVGAEDGVKALSLLETQIFDLIFMDLQMPEMDGIEATRKIREMEKSGTKKTPIVAMTANTMPSDLEKCREAGMDGFLPKPIKPATIQEEIHRLFFER